MSSFGRSVFLLLVLIGFNLSAAPTVVLASPACENSKGFTLADPDRLQGVRTKWRSLSRDQRNSIQPDLAGLTIATWMGKLGDVAVNAAELNLEPRRVLLKSPVISEDNWSEYISYVIGDGTAPRNLQEIESTIIPRHQYTPSQRDRLLLAFLQKIDDEYRSGRVQNNLGFVLHQRIWFRHGEGKQKQRKQMGRVADFAADMGGFIQEAKERCLDHWLLGIRLGENASPTMDDLLQTTLLLAEKTNRVTEGWLRSRLLLVNGPHWGARYDEVDIDEASFFKSISKQTGAFAIGYKFMDADRKEGGGSITNRMQRSACGAKACNANSVVDWNTFLNSFGLPNLIKFIEPYSSQYPMHANAVFLGDSSDGLTTIFEGRYKSALAALKGSFPKTPGFQGKIFMNGYIGSDTLFTRAGRTKADTGLALYYVHDGKATLLPKSFAEWKDWE